MTVDLSDLDGTYWKDYDKATRRGDPSTPINARTLNAREAKYGAAIELAEGYATAAQAAAGSAASDAASAVEDAVAESVAAAQEAAAQAAASAEQAAAPTEEMVTTILADPASPPRQALGAAFEPKFQVNAATYVTAGSTDETAAVQAALNAVAPGGTVIFPRLPSGQSYRISSTLTLTKANVRFLAGGRDVYAVNLRGMTPGMTILEVKAPGFIAEGVGFLGSDGNTTNGVGATITGLDLFGDTDGNIDCRVTGSSFQYLAVGVRTRGRNATITGDTLFSNLLRGVVIDGIDGTYHTGPSATQNRGNTIRACRFHNIGGASTDAAIEITPTARVLHALIEGNYFDSNGLGRHIVAAGTSANPHSKVTLRGNKHTEAGADAYTLTYVQNSTIADADIAAITGTSNYGNGIVLNNCDTVTISNVFGVQLGKSGVVARNCTKVRMSDVNWRAIGLDPSNVGHGFDVDSTNSLIRGHDLTVETADGWGWTGDPTNSDLSNCDFLSCALGRINATALTNRVARGNNAFTEGKFGRVEDVGSKTLDLPAGTATPVATVAAGSTFGALLVTVEFAARDGQSGNCYVLANRYIRPENGTPVIVTLGTDAISTGMTLTLAASGATAVALSLTSTNAVYGTVVVRARAGGAANGTNPRGATVTMA